MEFKEGFIEQQNKAVYISDSKNIFLSSDNKSERNIDF